MKEQKDFIRPLAEILTEVGIGFSETSSGQLVIDACYNCGRSKKLYVNAENGAYVCFRCDIKGGPVQLLKGSVQMNGKKAFELLFGKQGPEKIYDDNDDFSLPISITGKKRTKFKTKKELPKPISIPSYMKPLKQSDTDAWNYLKFKRGLTDDIIKELNIYHWSSAQRIVFLITVDGKIYGTLARDYIGNADKKVLNSSGNWRSFTVWNYDLAMESNELVICEGAFSAIKCGINRSVALFGKTATPGQIEIIRSTRAKKIYICLDVGTDAEQHTLFSQLTLYFPGNIFKIELPHVIENNKKISLELCEKLNNEFGINIKLDDQNSLICLDYHDKEKILNTCDIVSKMSSDEKLKQINSYLLKCSKSKFSEKDLVDIKWLILKAEYLDSGDYTFAEMESLIKKAKKFSGGPTNW